jgi:hypothetical protein
MAYVVGLLHEELEYSVRPSLAKRVLMEIEGYKLPEKDTKTTIVIDTDAKDSVERIYSLKSSLDLSKRRRIDVADCQEMLEYADIAEYRHICGATNPMDVLTKKYGRLGISKEKAAYRRFLQLAYSGKYVADLTAVERSMVNKNVRWCHCFYCSN